MGRSSSLVRTLALRAKGRRFKSGSAHHLLFSIVESKYLLNYMLRIASLSVLVLECWRLGEFYVHGSERVGC